MLQFFREYQRYFFILITIVIVISFSFFGTYNTLSDSPFREQIAFKTVDGTSVTRHELDEMVQFLNTDAQDKMLNGGAWGPNFLNDGVIKKDFLETGLAELLAADYSSELQPDLAGRFEKERRYSLYTHPQARFVGVESIWSYLAPQMSTAYNTLRISPDPLAPEALKARVDLYLMQQKLPTPLLQQVLRYQEKQYSWLKPDPDLPYTDLALFGYHSLEDWFGPRFTRLAAQFIVNAAQIAEQKGYKVSKTEALADLMRNSEVSYQQLRRSPNLGVKNSQEYFEEQLLRLGMDQNMAAKVWQQVMLFRRMFRDVGASVFVDPLTYQAFNDYALAAVEGTLYQLPKPVRLNSFSALQKFETYIDAVGKRSADEKAKLQLPAQFYTPAELAKKQPRLVQKRYLLNLAQVDKKILESGVSLKQTWEWETSDASWEQLKEEFVELDSQKGATREERFARLESLNPQLRARVDAFARHAIVNEHPEWLEKALQEAQSKHVQVALPLKGGNTPFVGLEEHAPLIELLDAASLPDQKSANKADQALAFYTADQNSYYRIDVLARSPELEVMSFAEAERNGSLEALLDKQLEAYYAKIRDADPQTFQLEENKWKPLADVKDEVAKRYFEKTLNAIRKSYTTAMASKKTAEEMGADKLAALRLYPYIRDLLAKFEKSPEEAAKWLQAEPQNSADKQRLSPPTQLADQWKLEKNSYQVARNSTEHLLDKTELFALETGRWTQVNTPANGDLNFFHLEQKISSASQPALSEEITRVRRILSDAIQQQLMQEMLTEIKTKKGISLEYLNQTAAQ